MYIENKIDKRISQTLMTWTVLFLYQNWFYGKLTEGFQSMGKLWNLNLHAKSLTY